MLTLILFGTLILTDVDVKQFVEKNMTLFVRIEQREFPKRMFDIHPKKRQGPRK